MRILLASTVLVLALSPMARARAAEPIPDLATIMQMEERAPRAEQRERSFLYAELAHIYTEIASQQIAAGDIEHATATLKHVEQYASLIHTELNHDSKRLKNSELLLHQTTHKLGEIVHYVSSEDKVAVQTTLKQLNKVNEEILAQVFTH